MCERAVCIVPIPVRANWCDPAVTGIKEKIQFKTAKSHAPTRNDMCEFNKKIGVYCSCNESMFDIRLSWSGCVQKDTATHTYIQTQTRARKRNCSQSLPIRCSRWCLCIVCQSIEFAVSGPQKWKSVFFFGEISLLRVSVCGVSIDWAWQTNVIE